MRAHFLLVHRSLILCITGEHQSISRSGLVLRASEHAFFWKMATMSGFVGGMLSFSTFWCISATGAVTYTVAGSLTKIPLVLFGILYSNTSFKTEQVAYIAFGVAGGMLFSYVKFQESKAQQAKQKRQ